MEKRNNFGIFNLIALSVLVIILISISTIGIVEKDENGSHLKSEESFQLILDVWNIDTFPGGSMSKKDYIDKVSRLYEINNKGVYIKCTNMSVEEFSLAIEDNKSPDVISFGFGVGNFVQPLLKPININCDNIKKEIISSGRIDGTQYAVGFLMGGYSFFTTAEKLENASKPTDVSLSKEYINCGYDVNLRKTKKHVYGLCVSNPKYLSSLRCLNEIDEKEIYFASDEYNAYLDFLGLNKSTILLGTQRDLIRLENKISNGSMDGLITEPVMNYNDLIQYIGLCADEKSDAYKQAKQFIEFIVSESAQKILENSGMFSTVINNLYEGGNLKELETAVWAVNNMPCVF